MAALRELDGRAVLGIVGGVLIVAALVVFFVVRGDAGGPTADAVADQIGRSCETKRTEPSPDVLKGDSALGSRSEEAVTITCASGYVNPVATVFRFASAEEARQAINDRAGPLRHRRMCLVGRDVVEGSVDQAFDRFCREIGGEAYPRLPTPAS